MEQEEYPYGEGVAPIFLPVDYSTLNYEEDLKINKYRLDEEWENQSIVMKRYSTAHAQAVFNKNRAFDAITDAESDVKRAFSRLDDIARATPPPANLAKQTDEAVKQWILRHPEYIAELNNVSQKRKEYTEAQHKADVLFGAVMAFNARKTALEELVKLHLNNYFSRPYVEGSGMSDTVDAATAQRQQDHEKQLADAMAELPRPEFIAQATQIVEPEVKPSPTPIRIQQS